MRSRIAADPRKRHGTLERAAVAAAGVYLTATGVSALASGRLIYANYLDAPMLAPLAILAGALLLAVSLFGWKAVAKHL